MFAAMTNTGMALLFSSQCDRKPNSANAWPMRNSSVVMVGGDSPFEGVDDRRITLVAVQPDVTARCHGRGAYDFRRFLSISLARSIAASTVSLTPDNPWARSYPLSPS